MPVLAGFNGIKIQFYADEHPPPHFHARYAEFIAQIALDDLRVIAVSLPTAQLRQVREWASTRKSQLFTAWTTLEMGQLPEAIS